MDINGFSASARIYEGIINGQKYRLTNVQDQFEGKGYKDLDMGDRRRLDDSIIHATVVRQDEPTHDQSSIYTIFERLNTGGINLQPQEIRVALYHGKFVQVLQQLSGEQAWRDLYGAKSQRLKDMEMILRFFAFLYYADRYRRPMKDFLNRYMASNRSLQKQGETELRQIFVKTTETILEGIGNKAFRPERAVNAAVMDSLMVGIAKRLTTKGDVKDKEELRRCFNALMVNSDYLRAVKTGTSQEANVAKRHQLAKNAFSQVKWTDEREVARLKQRLDATFKRIEGVDSDLELRSDFARYLCVLVSGYLETLVAEPVLEHARRSGTPTLHRFVEVKTRRFTNVNSQRLQNLLGSFDPDWRQTLESFPRRRM